jgi:hypothetical protein
VSSDFPTAVLIITLSAIVFLGWLGWRPRRDPSASPDRKSGAK